MKKQSKSKAAENTKNRGESKEGIGGEHGSVKRQAVRSKKEDVGVFFLRPRICKAGITNRVHGPSQILEKIEGGLLC